MNAPDKAIEIKAAVTGVIMFVTAIIGPVGWIVIVWFFAMLMDYLTGSVAASLKGEWDSTVAREGLFHKLGSIGAILVAAALDIALGVILPELGLEYKMKILTPTVCLWYLITELGSIIENIDKMGAPVPGFLRKMLKKVKTEVDTAGDKIADAIEIGGNENEEVSALVNEEDSTEE